MNIINNSMDFLVHFFVPHHLNDYRSKVLHHKSLFFLLTAFCIMQVSLLFFQSFNSSILGVATDISIDHLLEETNRKRVAYGLSELVLNEELSQAATQKAADMFVKNYWAHNAPDGTTPWVFIKNADYVYSFAGENLAKDFHYSQDVVDAWIASPKHRENLLSKNFDDIGFAVVNGKLNRKETTLVVQMFGRQGEGLAGSQPRAPQRGQTARTPSGNPPSLSDGTLIRGVTQRPLFDVGQVHRGLSIALLATLVSVFTLDMIIVRRRRALRLVGHNFDHILFLSGPLLLTLADKGGSIL